MQDLIKKYLHDPAQLEKLYRQSPVLFSKTFDDLYPEMKGDTIADTWYYRLHYADNNSFEWGNQNEIYLILLLSIISGCFIYFPVWFNWPAEPFLLRYQGFIVLIPISLYYFYKQESKISTLLIPVLFFISILCFVGFLSLPENSATGQLRNLHVPFLLWSIAGYVFTRNQLQHTPTTILYLQHNGNWLIFSVLMGLAVMLFGVLSIALFNLIGIHLETIYEHYIVRWIIGAFPLFTCYIILNNASLVNRVSPMIARIFAPVVLVTLFVFLLSLSLDPGKLFNNRELLITFNLVLFAVLAIVLFSLTLRNESIANNNSQKILVLLSLLTCIANLVALAAIVYRLASYGFTPNRTAILGANLIMFVHLAGISYSLLLAIKNKGTLQTVEKTIARWIPVYFVWAAIVAFAFPFLFNKI